MKPAAEIENLCKTYPSQKAHAAVKDLSLSIPEAQFYGLLGPDGAGKTTTLRILSTVMRASSGTVRMDGLDVVKQAEQIRRSIGYMPQNFSLYPDLSVLENLSFFAEIQGMEHNRVQIRMDEMLEFTHLKNFAHARARVLSGGMKKKLALACAMIHEPKILLLDEPSTGVDPISRRELWEILALVVRRGVTVVVSTPYMDEAERCHQVGVLYNGSLLASGTPQDLIKNLPYQIIEVNSRSRKKVREIVNSTSGILEWRPVGDRLRMVIPGNTRDSQHVLDRLAERFRKEKVEVKSLRPARSTMEDVFVHMVIAKRREK